MRRLLATVVAAVCCIALLGFKPRVHEERGGWKLPTHVTDQVLVRFKPQTSDAQVNALHGAFQTRVLRRYHIVDGLQLVQLPPRMRVDEAIGMFRSSGAVLYAEPNYFHHTHGTPDDPRFSSLWGLHNTGQSGGLTDADINAPEAWELTTGSDETVIAVIDTGVYHSHSDLNANMWVNSLETPGNGIDDDNNGYVDDVHGINARSNDGNLGDTNGHGTHCSGTIAGVGDNGVGVAGVNWRAKIIGCDFLGGGSGATSDGIQCLEYVADLAQREQDPVNVVATNNSWGGGGFEQSLFDAIEKHNDLGILFVAAAGNDGGNNDNGPHYPSNYDLPNVISVASTTRSDSKSGFSNYGRNTVHVGAPGSSIVSTTPNGYSSMSGTSMAAPHVTGLAALIHSQDPTRPAHAIKNLIMLGGQPTNAMQGRTISGARIRAADKDGRGSLTCEGQFLAEQLAPVRETSLVFRPDGIKLSAMSIECDGPSDSVTVTGQPGDLAIELADDGSGIFALDWVAETPGDYTLEFPTGDVREAEIFDDSYRGPVVESMVWREFTGTSLNFSDDETETITLPFELKFNNGHPGGANELIVSSNGILSLTDDNKSAGNPPLPVSNMLTVIAPFWDDLDPAKGGETFWAVLGEAPNREVVVEWRAVRHFDCSNGTVTFQAVMFESSPDILFNYADVSFGGADCDAGASATIGVQVTDRRALKHVYAAPEVEDNTALRFTLNRLSELDAGPDQVVEPGTRVELSGLASDPDGTDTIVSTQWTQLDGDVVALDDSSALQTGFTAPPTSQKIELELEVVDDGQVRLTDAIFVTVDIAPVADAGKDATAMAGATVPLDGSRSHDEDGTIVAFTWTQLSGPPVELVNADTVSPSFTAPNRGAVEVELTVTDDLGVSASDVVRVNVDEATGCACVVSGRTWPGLGLFAVMMLGLLAVVRRRR